MNISKHLLNLSFTMPFYAVAKGRQVGIYLTWSECESHVKGFNGAAYKKFSTKEDAKKFILSKGGKLSDNIDSDNEAEVNPSTVSVAESSNKRKWNEINASSHASNSPKTLIPKEYDGMTYLEDDDGYVHVFTDGSCGRNGQPNAYAGLGIYFGENHKHNRAEPVSGRATNNCGEIQASTLAIKLAMWSGIKKLCVNTDSQFLINAVEKWIPSWKRRNWCLKSGGPVKNQLDFIELDNVLISKQITIKWQYVKAHKGIFGNERADTLAKAGAEKYKRLKIL